MTDQHTPFEADDIDEQIDLSMQLLRATPAEETPAPDLRLIADLQHFYPANDQSVARSLARVRQRLLSSAPLASQGSQNTEPSARRHSLAERQQRMRFPHSLVRAGQRVSYRIAAIAAAVLLVLIIGSLAAGLVLVHHGNTGAGRQSHTPATSATAAPASNTANVYIASPAGLYKVDAKTGKLLWHTDGPSSYIVVAGGMVYSTAQGGEMLAVDAGNGKERWRSAVLSGDQGVTRFSVADGVIYAGSEADGQLYALDAGNGKVLWHAAIALDSAANMLPVFSAVQVVNGVLYGSFDLQVSSGPIYSYLYAASAKDGSVLWKSPAPAEQFFNGPLLVDGALYITSSEISHHSGSEAQDSYAYAFDPQTGKQLWQSYKTRGFVFADPAVGDGGVYFGAQTDALYAVKATDGSPLWSYPTGASSVYATARVVGNVVYAGETTNSGNNDFLLALDAKTGTLLWKHSIPAYFQDEFAASDQAVYVTSAEGAVYALSAKDGSQLWQYKYATIMGTQGGNVTLAP